MLASLDEVEAVISNVAVKPRGTLLMFDKTRAFERADQLGGCDRRQPGHASRGARTDTGTTNSLAVRFSTGNGLPSRIRLTR